MKNEITTKRLLKYLRRELSQQEMLEIEQWADQAKENEETLISLAKIYHLGQFARQYTQKEVDQAWEKVCRWEDGTGGKVTHAKRRRLSWFFYTSVAVIACLLVLNSILLLNRKETSPSNNHIVLTSQDGKFIKYTLPDGSVVTLNNKSSLEFPVVFNADERRVKLNGEGFFEVAENKKCPFIVETMKGITVKVLGTKFNLQSFSNDDIVQISLISGSVEVGVEGKEKFSYVMHPSERFTCNVNTREMNVETMVGIDGTEWMNNKLVFRETPLKEVARQISNYFGVQVLIDAPELSRIRFSGTFDNHGLETVLSYMEKTCGIRTKTTPDTVVIYKK